MSCVTLRVQNDQVLESRMGEHEFRFTISCSYPGMFFMCFDIRSDWGGERLQRHLGFVKSILRRALSTLLGFLKCLMNNGLGMDKKKDRNVYRESFVLGCLTRKNKILKGNSL